METGLLLRIRFDVVAVADDDEEEEEEEEEEEGITTTGYVLEGSNSCWRLMSATMRSRAAVIGGLRLTVFFDQSYTLLSSSSLELT